LFARAGLGRSRENGTSPECGSAPATLLQLFALAYHLADFIRQLVLPKPIQDWTLTTLREEQIKIGAKVVAHARYVTFQLAQVAVPPQLFVRILERISQLRLACASG
jgi:hypothetical protein